MSELKKVTFREAKVSKKSGADLLNDMFNALNAAIERINKQDKRILNMEYRLERLNEIPALNKRLTELEAKYEGHTHGNGLIELDKSFTPTNNGTRGRSL